MNKICSKCSREYAEDATVCFRCGISLNPEKPAQERQAVPPLSKKLSTSDLSSKFQQPASVTSNKPALVKGPATAPRSQTTPSLPSRTQSTPQIQNQDQNITSRNTNPNEPPKHRRPLPVPKARTTSSNTLNSSQISQINRMISNQVNSQGNQPSFDNVAFENQKQQSYTEESTPFSFEQFNPNPSESSLFQQQEKLFNENEVKSTPIQQQLPPVVLEKSQPPTPLQKQPSFTQPYSEQNFQEQLQQPLQQQQQPQQLQQQQYYQEMKDTTSPFQRQPSFTQPYGERNNFQQQLQQVQLQQQQQQQPPVVNEKVQPIQQQPYFSEVKNTPPLTQPPTTSYSPYQKISSSVNASTNNNASPYFLPFSNSEMSLHHSNHEKKPRGFFSRNKQDPKKQISGLSNLSNLSNYAQLTPIATEFPTQLTNKPQKLWPHEEAALVKYNVQQNKIPQNNQNKRTSQVYLNQGLSQPNQAKRLQALWDCSSERVGDLEFSFGDIIYVLQESDNGWWQGQLENGKIGVFPVNYTAECNY